MTATKILMVAAENDALPNCKAGGIADVVRDIPRHLAEQGMEVTVVCPAYDHFIQLPADDLFVHLPAEKSQGRVNFSFRGQADSAEVFLAKQEGDIKHLLIQHLDFVQTTADNYHGQIYIDDGPQRPFASDANRFALFCLAVAEGLRTGIIARPDYLHLHDWHAAFLLLLRRYAADYQTLIEIPTVFTIHNLGLQGIRPLDDDESSLVSWYPDLIYEPEMVRDPRWPDCLNPMAVGIRLADRVHAVSPGYSREIVKPSAPGFHGGEGLERDLQQAKDEGRLHGILNGCEYPPDVTIPARLPWGELLTMLTVELDHWLTKQGPRLASHLLAVTRLKQWRKHNKPAMLLTSVGRITEQKVELLQAKGQDGESGLALLLKKLGPNGLLFIMGTGDPLYEDFLTRMSGQYDNFIYLNGFSSQAAEALYGSGDLFVMPSSFEPCGISQMLAMRAGQPCLVHGVGGLADTVADNKTGFSFSGPDQTAQVEAMVRSFAKAKDLFQHRPGQWQQLCTRAAALRFSWPKSIRDYRQYLYVTPNLASRNNKQ